MKNLIEEKPTNELHGRVKFTVGFVDDKDVKGKEILDIGCGYGWCELDFLNRGAKKIVGSEITETDLKTIKKYLKDKRLSFNVSGATKLPFKDNSFDTVVSWEVIEHIPPHTEDLMYSEVARVLKPGGVFYLSTPYRSFMSTAFDPAWWLISHRHYTKKQLKTFAEKHGFRVEKMNVRGAGWELFGILSMYFFKWVFHIKVPYYTPLSKKIDTEYNHEGFIDIFCKFKKKK